MESSSLAAPWAAWWCWLRVIAEQHLVAVTFEEMEEPGLQAQSERFPLGPTGRVVLGTSDRFLGPGEPGCRGSRGRAGPSLQEAGPKEVAGGEPLKLGRTGQADGNQMAVGWPAWPAFQSWPAGPCPNHLWARPLGEPPPAGWD